jgi:hypothetical protein
VTWAALRAVWMEGASGGRTGVATPSPVPPAPIGGGNPALPAGEGWPAGRVGGDGSGASAVLVAMVAGAIGSLVDSWLGATVQGRYWCERCGEPTEAAVHGRCGEPARLTGGLPWMTNDAVNALATASGSIVGALLGGGLR